MSFPCLILKSQPLPSLSGPSSLASPLTLAKLAYALYSYLYMADSVWYHFSWRYLHLIEFYDMFAQYFLFSPKRWLYKSLFQGTISFLYSPVTTKELDG